MPEGAVCGGIAASSLASWITMWKGAEVSGQHRHESTILLMGSPAPLGPSDDAALADVTVMAS